MRRIAFLILCIAAIMGGCDPVVYKQAIPVTTDPMGADVFVDGAPAGVTPANLELARNQDHIVTLSKPGYRQEDVTVKRVYQAETAMLNAVSKGVSDADFFKSDSMGLQSGVNSIEYDKETGKAYTLSPGTIKVRMMPVGGIGAAPAAKQAAPSAAVASAPAPKQVAAKDAPQAGVAATGIPTSQTTPQTAPADVVTIMSVFDREMLDRVLETGKSGQGMGWTSPSNGWHFHVVPDPAQMMDGVPVRTFKVVADKDGSRVHGKYPAYRENRNDWRIGYPHELSSGQPDVAPVNERALTFGALKAAASGMKPVGGSTKVGGSSHSSESWGSDGSYTKTTTKTSTSVGVSVDPAGAVDLLEQLTRPEGQEGQ